MKQYEFLSDSGEWYALEQGHLMRVNDSGNVDSGYANNIIGAREVVSGGGYGQFIPLNTSITFYGDAFIPPESKVDAMFHQIAHAENRQVGVRTPCEKH